MFNEEKYVHEMVKREMKKVTRDTEGLTKLFEEMVLYIMNEFDFHLTPEMLSDMISNNLEYISWISRTSNMTIKCINGCQAIWFDMNTLNNLNNHNHPVHIRINVSSPNQNYHGVTWDNTGFAMYADTENGRINKTSDAILYYNADSTHFYEMAWQNANDLNCQDILDPDEKLEITPANSDEEILENFKLFIQFVKAKRNELLESDKEKTKSLLPNK